jgi:hypothetical protein
MSIQAKNFISKWIEYSHCSRQQLRQQLLGDSKQVITVERRLPLATGAKTLKK